MRFGGLVFALLVACAFSETSQRKPKILLLQYGPPERVAKIQDGFFAAVNILRESFDIDDVNVYDRYDLPDGHYDAIWVKDVVAGHADSLTRVYHSRRPNIPKALLISGQKWLLKDNAEIIREVYQMVFYETEWYGHHVRTHHPNARWAFGINADVFYPADPPLEKMYDTIVVGHFMRYKRPYKILEQPGPWRVAVGHVIQHQPESKYIMEVLREVGVDVVDMEALTIHDVADYYRMSRLVYFPMLEDGGGERGVLEARACGSRVKVEDNPNLQSLTEIPIPSHHDYAASLAAGTWDLLGVPTPAPLAPATTQAEAPQHTDESTQQVCGAAYDDCVVVVRELCPPLTAMGHGVSVCNGALRICGHLETLCR